MLDHDALDQDHRRVSLAATMREATRGLRDPRPPLTAMLKTAQAVRYTTRVGGLSAVKGPLAERAQFTAIDASAPQPRLERWNLHPHRAEGFHH